MTHGESMLSCLSVACTHISYYTRRKKTCLQLICSFIFGLDLSGLTNICPLKIETKCKSTPFENKQPNYKFLLVVLYSIHKLSKNTFIVHSMDHCLRFSVVSSECPELGFGRCLCRFLSSFA
jgi:hypothetical protein